MAAIFVAFMFVSLVITDLSVEKWRVWRAQRTGRVPASNRAFAPETLWQVPEGVHLSSAHTWLRPDPAGGLEIGADALIGYAIGSASQIILPNPGDHVTVGQPLFRVERGGRSITVPCTLTGKVVAVNGRLQNQPNLLNSDPYGSGWVCHLTPTAIGAAPASVRFGEAALLWLENEFTRLGGFLSAQIPAALPLGATSQDGGFPSSGCLGELDDAAWTAFEAEFLKVK